MNERNVIHFPKSISTPVETANQRAKVRAKSIKIHVSLGDIGNNYDQYVKTVKAYALAGVMDFEDIAKAGDSLGDRVERNIIDAPLQNSLQNKLGEVVEGQNIILAWQTRGEKDLTTPQLASPEGIIGNEISVSRELTTVPSNQEQMVDVVEGIAVQKQEPINLSDYRTNSGLENNPYLQPIQELKKAA